MINVFIEILFVCLPRIMIASFKDFNIY